MRKVEITATLEELVEWTQLTGAGTISECLRTLVEEARRRPQLPPAPSGKRQSHSVRLEDAAFEDFHQRAAAARMNYGDYLRAVVKQMDEPPRPG